MKPEKTTLMLPQNFQILTLHKEEQNTNIFSKDTLPSAA